MEYGLWNFHGGLWPGGNNSFTPADSVTRNFYNSVNNEIEPPTFHVTAPASGDVTNTFNTGSGIQPCQANLRTNFEFFSMKNTLSMNSRVPALVLPGNHDDHLQNVGLEVPLASDLVSEQSSIDSLAPTDSTMPQILSQQPNSNINGNSHHHNNTINNYNNSHNSNNNNNNSNNNNNYTNHNNNNNNNNDDDDDNNNNDNNNHNNNNNINCNHNNGNNIPNNNNNNSNSNNDDTNINNCRSNKNNNSRNNNCKNKNIGDVDDDDNDDDDDEPPAHFEKDKSKIGRKDTEEVWEGINGHGTNIKIESNSAVDYLFQQSYQHPMYGMMFSRMSNNKKEPGTSDETDEEDDEGEEVISQPRTVEIMQNNSSSMQDRFPVMSSVPITTPVSFSKNGYECGECGLVAETRPSLKKHLAVFHPTPNTDLRLTNSLLKKMSVSAKCPMTSCRFRSSDRNEIEAHMAQHVTGGYKLNGKRRAGPLTPQRVRYEREEYRCQICAYSCTVEKAFYKHLKVHSVGREVNQVKISCVICGKDRSSEIDMNKHMKKHRDDRYFCCDICIFKTVQLKKLIQHRRMHTGEKPHLCPHCSYRSARRDNLRSHVRRVHKKDNLFCDTFSPRGLLLTQNSSNTTTSTPVAATNQSHQQHQPPPPLV